MVEIIVKGECSVLEFIGFCLFSNCGVKYHLCALKYSLLYNRDLNGDKCIILITHNWQNWKSRFLLVIAIRLIGYKQLV